MEALFILLTLPLTLAADVDEAYLGGGMARYILRWLYLRLGGNYELINGRDSDSQLPSGIVLLTALPRTYGHTGGDDSRFTMCLP